jgi:hypothetical protein
MKLVFDKKTCKMVPEVEEIVNNKLTIKQKKLIESFIKKEGGPHSCIEFLLKERSILSLQNRVKVDIDNTKRVDIEDIVDYIETIRCIITNNITRRTKI